MNRSSDNKSQAKNYITDGDYFINLANEKLNMVPFMIAVEVTTKCPLNCSYCKRKYSPSYNKNLTKERFKVLIEKLVSFEKIMFCGLGEPFIDPDIYSYVSLIPDKKVTIVTSGTLDIDFERLNKSGNVELIIFSIDTAISENAKKICGSGYNLTKLKKNLSEAQNYPGIKRTINITFNEKNIGDLVGTVKFAINEGMQGVTLSLPHKNRKFVSSYIGKIKKAIKEAQDIKVVNEFLRDPVEIKCIVFDTMVPYINLKGELHPCIEAIASFRPVGNIYENNFLELWDNKKYQEAKSGKYCNNCDTMDIVNKLIKAMS